MNVAMNATGLSDSDLLEEDVMLTNDNTTEFELDGFQEFANYFQFIVEGIAILIVGIIGVGINLVALGILFRKRVMRNFHSLMCSLAVYDFLHNILGPII